MRRHECMMCEEFGGKIYCSYYDLMYMLCEENQNCPEGLDDDDDDEYDDEYDENNEDYFWKD